MNKDLTLKPRLSEKSVAHASKGVYVFQVPTDANKHAIARAIEAQFEVSVSEVNILVAKGKTKRTVTKRGGRAASGKRPDVKKAYVTLVEGQSLPLFEADQEAEEKQQAAQAKIDKAAAKIAEKEAKKDAKAEKKEKK